MKIGLFLFSILAAPSYALKLEQGTFTVGGHFAVPYTYNASVHQQIAFREEPEMSFFVADNVRLVASFEFEALLRWSNDYPVTPGLNTWGAKFGAQYVFPVSSSVFFSSGLSIGMRAHNALFGSAHGLLEFPLALWWALNENVALTAAFPIELAFSRQFGFESLAVTPGYFGLVGFF